MLNERAQHLLRVMIERYIQDGQPVSSRALSRDSGLALSPATIRNVMADLEDLGFVCAPHTSAGRVPTQKGYRCFVDTLLSVKPLGKAEVRRLRAQLGVNDSSSKELVSSASGILSGLTRLAGLVTVPKVRYSSLRRIEFLGLSDNRVLSILVVNEKEVQNRILALDHKVDQDALDRAANYLNDQFAGRTVSEVRDELVNAMQNTREHMNQAMLDAITMGNQAFAEEKTPPKGLVFAGETNLMDFAELSDVDHLRRLFEAFAEQRGILGLLDQSLDADGVQIFIGDESGYDLLDECSIVTAPYTIDDDVVGVLGVIGPTRMAYSRVIPIVDITAKLLSSALNSRD